MKVDELANGDAWPGQPAFRALLTSADAGAAGHVAWAYSTKFNSTDEVCLRVAAVARAAAEAAPAAPTQPLPRPRPACFVAGASSPADRHQPSHATKETLNRTFGMCWSSWSESSQPCMQKQ